MRRATCPLAAIGLASRRILRIGLWFAPLIIAASVAAGTAEAQGCAVVGITPIPNIPQPNGYVATEILDLEFAIQLDPDGLGTNLVLEISFHSPDGHLYQKKAIPFTTATTKRNSTRSLPGYPHPMPVQQAYPPKAAGAQVVEVRTRLPVAGTAIVSHSLYGDWRLDLVLDGQTLGCVEGNGFEITLTPSSEIFGDHFESGNTSAWSFTSVLP